MKIGPPGGHLDQMMRQTRAHHVQLSIMADTKANMLLSVSAIVIPLTIGFVNDDSPPLKYASITLVIFSVITAALAAYAAMPKILRGKPTDPGSQMFNPLFFGDFIHLSYDQFLQRLEEVMVDPARTHEAQAREIYTLGLYLAKRKYKFLRLGYLSFITGVVCSGAVWVVTELIVIFSK